MSTLNQIAPPAEAPKTGDFIKFQPFPKSDTVVMTVTGFNFIASHPFERKDDKTGVKFIKNQAAIEIFYGAAIGGVPYFVKTWPQAYSINEKANYSKIYEAAVGKAPGVGSNPADMVGKHVLGTLKVEDKISAKGTKYRVTQVKSVTAVPSILAATGTSLAALLPALTAALAGGAAAGSSEEAPF